MVPSVAVYEPDCAPEVGPYSRFPAPSVMNTQSKFASVVPPKMTVTASAEPSPSLS